jgi:hypothetical protein
MNMQLHELNWSSMNDEDSEHWALGVGGTSINIVRSKHESTYTIFTNRGHDDPYWDLDPWTAQAVLHHLLKE